MTWKRRLAIFLSVLWLLVASIAAINSYNSLGDVLALGILPLTILWGGWWVITGGKRRSRFPENGQAQDSAAEKPEKRVDELGVTNETKGNNRLKMAVGVLFFLVLAAAAKQIADRAVTAARIDNAVSDGSIVDLLGLDEKTPLEFIKAANADLEKFKTGAKIIFEKSYAKEGSAIKVLNIETKDLVATYLVTTTFVGDIQGSEEKNLTKIKGVNRRYYNPSGLLELEGFCKAAESSCDKLDLLLDEAHRKVLTNLSLLGVGGILPESGSLACEIKPRTVMNYGELTTFDEAVCFYHGGIFFTFSRFSVEQFRKMNRARANDMQGKEVLRSTVN